MIEYETFEDSVLDAHEPKWVADGYRVVRRPSQAALPPFLHGFTPDALLIGREPKVVVEVVAKGDINVPRKMDDLKKRLRGHEDWRVEVLFAGQAPAQLRSMTLRSLEDAVATVRRLADDEPRGALLLAWATIEAVARYLEPERTKRPQSPARVVEVLASGGHITPSQAQTIRDAIKDRNNIVHGELDIRPSKEAIAGLAEIVEHVLESLEPTNPHPDVTR